MILNNKLVEKVLLYLQKAFFFFNKNCRLTNSFWMVESFHITEIVNILEQTTFLFTILASLFIPSLTKMMPKRAERTFLTKKAG